MQDSQHPFRLVLYLATLLCVWATTASGQSSDRIRHGGTTTEGKIFRISAFDITILAGGESTVIPVSEITSVEFGDEPSELGAARSHVAGGRFGQAKKQLQRIDRATIERPEIMQDLEYYLAYCDVQLALAGKGDLQSAGPALYQFLRNEGNRESYHYLEGCQTLGDVFFALGKFAQAESFYRQLAKAPWPQAQADAALGIGRTLQARGTHAEAIEQFEALAQLEANQQQRLAGSLGTAVSLAHDPSTADQALEQVAEIISAAAPEDDDVLGSAYLALGKIHLERKESKPALFALLRVHLLYPVDPEGHADALAQLANVWSTVGQADRSAEATALLRQLYPNSRHAR